MPVKRTVPKASAEELDSSRPSQDPKNKPLIDALNSYLEKGFQMKQGRAKGKWGIKAPTNSKNFKAILLHARSIDDADFAQIIENAASKAGDIAKSKVLGELALKLAAIRTGLVQNIIERVKDKDESVLNSLRSEISDTRSLQKNEPMVAFGDFAEEQWLESSTGDGSSESVNSADERRYQGGGTSGQTFVLADNLFGKVGGSAPVLGSGAGSKKSSLASLARSSKSLVLRQNRRSLSLTLTMQERVDVLASKGKRDDGFYVEKEEKQKTRGGPNYTQYSIYNGGKRSM